MAIPETRYARSGEVNIAYQVIGDSPLVLVYVMGWVSHIEQIWQEPRVARFLHRLASFSRLVLFDKRGMGLSDRVPLRELPTLEGRRRNLREVVSNTLARASVTEQAAPHANPQPQLPDTPVATVGGAHATLRVALMQALRWPLIPSSGARPYRCEWQGILGAC